MASAVVQHFKFQFADSAARRNSGRLCCRAEEVVRVLCIWGALHEMLRGRLVWGIKDSHIQHRLLAESSLTFVKAIEIAQAMELATQDLKDLQFASASSTSVYKLQGRNHLYPKRFQIPPPCYHCGGKHFAAHCRFRTEWCQSCNKVGPIAKM